MKLLRYGPKGKEKPGLLDANGKIRDLSKHVDDISGKVLSPASLKKLAKLDPAKLPAVRGNRSAASARPRRSRRWRSTSHPTNPPTRPARSM